MFKDFTHSEQSNVNEYIECFDINNQDIDFDTLDTYNDSKAVLNASNINDIIDITNNVQSAYNEDVNGKLEEYNEYFQFYIDRLRNVKQWESGSEYSYYKNDIVKTDDDTFFLCIQDTDGTSSLPTTSDDDTAYWARIDLRGIKGLPSWGLKYVGVFNWENSNYNINDVVYVKGEESIKYFVCIKEISYISTPPSLDSDTEHWSLLHTVVINKFVIDDIMPTQMEHNYMQPFGVETYITDDYSNIYIFKEFTDNPQDLKYLDLETTVSQVHTAHNGISLSQLLRNILAEYNL